MRRTWIVLFSIIAMQFVWAAEKPIADVFTRSASAPVTNVKSSEPQHFVGHYDMPPLPLARDTFATYAYSYGDIVIFSYADSNECEIIDSAGNKIWSGLLMLDEYRLQKGITPGVYMIQASKAFTVLSGDPFTTGICNWTAVDQNSSPLSTKMLSVGPSRSEGVPVIAVFAYQDSTYVTVRNLDNQTIIWEGYLDSAKYYLREQGEVPPIVYSVEASKPVYTMTGGGLGGKYIPSYDGTFVGRDFITYQQLWRAGEAHDLQIIPWEDKTTVSVVDLNNPLDTIWREFFSKKGEVKGQRIPLPGTGRALYIHSDKDISLSENPWVSFGPSSSIGFFLIRSIDRNGLGIGTEFHQPLEGSVSWSTPYVYSRLLVVAYSDNTDVTITRTPRYGGADEPVWKGKLSRGQYYRYTCPLDDVNAWATYHVTSSEGVSVIGNCRDTEGSDFLPLWFAIHPGVLVLPSPQYKETECGVPTSESNSGAYLTIIRNTGNIADLMNIELTNSLAPDFKSILTDTADAALPDIDGNGDPDTDTLDRDASITVKVDVAPSDTVPFGTIDTCFMGVTSARDARRQDTAYLITTIRRVDIHLDSNTLVNAYPGDTAVITVLASNTSYYREDTVNLSWTSTKPAGWPVKLTDITGTGLYDSDGDSKPDVSGVLPLEEPSPFQVRIGVPDNAMAGDQDTVYVVGTSANYPLRLYPTATDTVRLIVNVLPVPAILIRPDYTDSVRAGDTIRYTMEVLNSGNGPDVPDIEFSTIRPGWNHRLATKDGSGNLADTDTDGTPDIGTLPGLSGGVPGIDSFIFEVNPPYGALPGQLDTSIVYAYSSLFDTVYDSAIVVTKVRGVVKLDIEPDAADTIRTGDDPLEARYILEVKNWGGAPDTVEIWSYASPDIGWTYTLTDTLGGALTDYDGDGVLDVGSVDSAQTKYARLTVQPQAGLGGITGDFDTTVIETRFVCIRTRYTGNPNLVNDSVRITTFFEPRLDIHNYPNPFRTSTTFAYSIPSAGYVSLKIYNRAGEHVRTVIDNEHFERGGMFETPWDGLTSDNKRPAPGVYLYTLEWTGDLSKGLIKTRRVVKKALLQP